MKLLLTTETQKVIIFKCSHIVCYQVITHQMIQVLYSSFLLKVYRRSLTSSNNVFLLFDRFEYSFSLLFYHCNITKVAKSWEHSRRKADGKMTAGVKCLLQGLRCLSLSRFMMENWRLRSSCDLSGANTPKAPDFTSNKKHFRDFHVPVSPWGGVRLNVSKFPEKLARALHLSLFLWALPSVCDGWGKTSQGDRLLQKKTPKNWINFCSVYRLLQELGSLNCRSVV